MVMCLMGSPFRTGFRRKSVGGYMRPVPPPPKSATGYREAYQFALEVEDMEAKETGFQLGYLLMNSPTRIQGYSWVVMITNMGDLIQLKRKSV